MMKKILIILILFLTNATFSQEKDFSSEKKALNEALEYKTIKQSLIAKNKFQARANSLDQRIINPDGTVGGINIKGNITFVANNIVNARVCVRTYWWGGCAEYSSNSPYDGYTQNGSLNMQYIDVDGFVDEDGDSNDDTFSSSSDELNLPACSRVVYAGLYWASVYPYESWSNTDSDDRRDDYNTMKFRLPGGSYQNITADPSSPTNTREVLVDDGYTYIFNKDITALVQGLSTPANPDGHNGTYVAANIIATTGQGGNGSSAGWTMVIVYQNETESSKNIAVFDGYAEIDGSNNVDLTYSGFTTIPVGPDPADPAPVRASVLAAALEGDRGIGGDRFQIQDNTVPTGIYRDQSTTNLNPANNFFNGSISRYDSFVTTRTPDSENSLGFDVDLYELNNPDNSVITNGQTSANVRFTTTGDVYYPFLNALAVEIIQPEVQLLKTITDPGGLEISGTPVGLGSELYYKITFQNVGTDDATNTIITDRLPKNVDLLEVAAPNGSVAPDGTRFNIDLPAGVTIVAYDPPAVGNGFRAELEFSVPDSMVLEGGIYMKLIYVFR
ncbi:hypothetical protein RRF68_01690 [Tenacibaculum sp. HL-MS23]|uniref:hypothetical protein n=1 Tax=Tenacibaculum sp. HL-MS23 TaxID=3077734 RepID=UPI0028FC1B1E|nr:hypothetical protein [Tenacibaculum sp. HL-MS23]WNW02158.1 hypothetical protein RRF68_01690 [Tenacibaculum sp. HL-MS23]